MTPEVRKEVRKLRESLCTMAVIYKGVKPEACEGCESHCEPGKQLLKFLGLKPEYKPRISDVFENVHYARGRQAQKVVHALNRRSK